MNLITATELRTKTKDLFEALLNGEEISLVHRSKIIGTFKPKRTGPKPFDAEAFMKITKNINLPILSDEELDKRYRAAMMKKYGKYIRRHKHSI